MGKSSQTNGWYLSSNIKISTLNNQKIFQFKVKENENVNFESGKLQHKTELSEFLENKTKTKKRQLSPLSSALEQFDENHLL